MFKVKVNNCKKNAPMFYYSFGICGLKFTITHFINCNPDVSIFMLSHDNLIMLMK